MVGERERVVLLCTTAGTLVQLTLGLWYDCYYIPMVRWHNWYRAKQYLFKNLMCLYCDTVRHSRKIVTVIHNSSDTLKWMCCSRLNIGD